MFVFLFFETFDLVCYDNPWDLFPRPFDLFVRTPSEIVLQLEASFPSLLFPSPICLMARWARCAEVKASDTIEEVKARKIQKKTASIFCLSFFVFFNFVPD